MSAARTEVVALVDRTGRVVGSAERPLVRRDGELLAPFGVPVAGREVTALLYLVDLAVR